MNATSTPKKNLLFEVSIIRPLVIFLLVIYHSLCIFTGGWELPQGVAPNDVYWWLGHLISGFRIETIAFVGGYVFAYQCVALKKRIPFHKFAWKKFKRLMIPCWIFGVVFFFLFRYHPGMKWNVCMWRILNGVEHLWFLPMLFWCFLLTWGLDRLLRLPAPQEEEKTWQRVLLWVLLAVTAIGPMIAMPGLKLGLTRVPHFIFYFFFGYVVWYLFCGRGEQPTTRYEQEAKELRFREWSGVCLIAYVLLLLLHTRICNPKMLGMNAMVVSSWVKPMLNTLTRVVSWAECLAGIMALYLFVKQLLSRKEREHADTGYRPKEWIIWSSKVCYGTYVFHMFFMKWIVYKTSFCTWMGGSAIGWWSLPWVMSLMTFAFSIGLTVLFLKSKVGRWLIG